MVLGACTLQRQAHAPRCLLERHACPYQGGQVAAVARPEPSARAAIGAREGHGGGAVCVRLHDPLHRARAALVPSTMAPVVVRHHARAARADALRGGVSRSDAFFGEGRARGLGHRESVVSEGASRAPLAFRAAGAGVGEPVRVMPRASLVDVLAGAGSSARPHAFTGLRRRYSRTRSLEKKGLEVSSPPIFHLFHASSPL